MISLKTRVGCFGFIQFFLIFLIGSILANNQANAQEKSNIYSARGYWHEQNNEIYKNLELKQERGDVLTFSENSYLKDFRSYLKIYFDRMTEEEQESYFAYKDKWENAQKVGDDEYDGEFEWRPRDRILNGLYGFWYGTSLIAIMEPESAAAIGIPLITSGLWLMGPAMFPKKYQNISRSTIRLSNTGKLFGLGYGAAFGLLLADSESDNGYKAVLGISTLGSIGLGEVAFQYQKKNNLSPGHIFMLRHYGILGGWLGLASAISLESENSRVYGGMVLAGGIAGILTGNKQALKNNFTSGDVYLISSLSLSMTGIGFALAVEMMDNMDYNENKNTSWPILIPAATSIIGTAMGQRQVRNVNLTKKQGSTISLATAGGGLVGLGIAAITETGSPAIFIGIPSGLALLSNQLLFRKYKSENLNKKFTSALGKKHSWKLSFDIKPENYFVNQNMTELEDYFTGGEFNSPKSLVNLKLKF